MKLQHLLVILGITLTSTACSNWIYRIDVPQGNFLDQRDVEKLRVGMTKEQVIYVLGNPVVQDSFDDDTWYYVYDMKRGMKKRGEDFGSQAVLARYQEWRRFDATALALTMDAFNKLFSNDDYLLRKFRTIGMGVVDLLPNAKRTFIREAAGVRGNLPYLMR